MWLRSGSFYCLGLFPCSWRASSPTPWYVHKRSVSFWMHRFLSFRQINNNRNGKLRKGNDDNSQDMARKGYHSSIISSFFYSIFLVGKLFSSHPLSKFVRAVWRLEEKVKCFVVKYSRSPHSRNLVISRGWSHEDGCEMYVNEKRLCERACNCHFSFLRFLLQELMTFPLSLRRNHQFPHHHPQSL